MARKEQRRTLTDVSVLAALAHPVRVQLLQFLVEVGPRTATQCASVVDASPSACSYHLRHMESFGFVERVADGERGDDVDGRERLWQASATGFTYGGPPSTDDMPMAATRQALTSAAIDENARLAKRYARDSESFDASWRDTAFFGSYGLQLTTDELVALSKAIDDVVRPYIGVTRDDAPDGSAMVHVSIQMFPRSEQ